MTDLEMTKLCAEAIGITHSWTDSKVYFGTGAWNLETSVSYQPLHDDAQAMALIKQFNISQTAPSIEDCLWYAWTYKKGGVIASDNLNRAVVELVAKMQTTKVSAA